MIVRRAVKEDIKDICAVEKEHAGYSAWGEEGMEKEFYNKHSITLVCEDRGKILGFANFWIIGKCVDLNSIAVRKEALGGKAGSLLLGKVVEYAGKNLCDRIQLEVNRRNARAIRFFWKNGFRKNGMRPKFYGDGQNAVLMCLKAGK